MHFFMSERELGEDKQTMLGDLPLSNIELLLDQYENLQCHSIQLSGVDANLYTTDDSVGSLGDILTNDEVLKLTDELSLHGIGEFNAEQIKPENRGVLGSGVEGIVVRLSDRLVAKIKLPDDKIITDKYIPETFIESMCNMQEIQRLIDDSRVDRLRTVRQYGVIRIPLGKSKAFNQKYIEVQIMENLQAYNDSNTFTDDENSLASAIFPSIEKQQRKIKTNKKNRRIIADFDGTSAHSHDSIESLLKRFLRDIHLNNLFFDRNLNQFVLIDQ